MVEQQELKPCPFCGGKAEPIVARVDESTKTYSVICTQCYTGIFRPRMKGMEWCAYRTENEAIASWNNRIPPTNKEIEEYIEKTHKENMEMVAKLKRKYEVES